MKNLPLGDLSLETFLGEYWQKKPLLIRQALPGIKRPIAADELAGLACEEEVESRLIIQDPISDQWELSHGPFTDATFSALPAAHWTLLVQAVDHWVPAAADFLAQFYFIPSWRVDDLMISYSGDKGGVGPHYDNYDVFLVQVSGRRQWEVGGVYDETSPRRSDVPVKILSEWKPEQRWILEPGDLLYVPPRVGHNGIAVSEDCMTCSVGFRAPSHRDILLDYSESVGEAVSEEVRYADPDLVPQANPGQITSEAVRKVQRIFTRYVEDEAQLAQWFGCYMTSPKYQDEETTPEEHRPEDVRTHLLEGGKLVRNEGSRFAFHEHGQNIWLFVDGRQYTCSGLMTDLVKTLCAERQIGSEHYVSSEGHDSLLLDLLSHGSLYLSS
ncbi:JmjC domain-containing protein [Nitrospira sp. T9]|uniref:JmjC domain-containing protein n=1 Tax=unclassified Nitrospira TaxID=2652172 RepID=UPI003F9C7C00